MAPCPRTMMFSSHMAGTYAPPAVDGPCTTATWDALRGHDRLVEEDAPAGGEYLRLQGQEGAARVHQVGAREPVLEGDLLRAELLLDGERVERPALHRHVVADHHRLVAGDRADTGHQAAGRRRVLVAAVGRERHQLEEGRAGVEQALDPLAHEEAAALLVPPPRLGRPTLADARQARAQLPGEGAVVARVLLERRVAAEPRAEPRHAGQRAQCGGRFSRNAAMPSSPSSLARRRAISSQV